VYLSSFVAVMVGGTLVIVLAVPDSLVCGRGKKTQVLRLHGLWPLRSG
jgi:hypothetical protein